MMIHESECCKVDKMKLHTSELLNKKINNRIHVCNLPRGMQITVHKLPKGVYNLTSGKFGARIYRDRQTTCLGHFDTIEEASDAYLGVAKIMKVEKASRMWQPGIFYYARKKKFGACIYRDGKQTILGYFETSQEADEILTKEKRTRHIDSN